MVDNKQIRFSQAPPILLLTIWIGTITGLVEGISLYLLQRQFELSGQLTFVGSAPEIIWISPLVDSILFGLVSILIILVCYFVSKLPGVKLSLITSFIMMFFSWLFIPLAGHISVYSIVLLSIGFGIAFYRLIGKYVGLFIQISRKSILFLGALTILVFVEVEGGSILQESRATANLPHAIIDAPNILMIVVDTLRADHLSVYGYSRQTSPNIDNYALQGTLFENAISTSSWTQPAHASFLTGKYTFEHGAELKPLDKRFPTLPAMLLADGYRTGAFSGNIDVFNRHNGFGRGFIHFEDYYQTIGNIFENSLYGRVLSYYFLHGIVGIPDGVGRMRADRISKSVLDWILKDQTHPFFVFINYYDVHAPYTPPQPYRSKYSKTKKNGGLINTYWDTTRIYVPKTSEEIQSEIDAYDGSIAYVDESIRWLLNELRVRDLLKNTIIIITSDHGEAFGEHGLLEHTNALYWEEIHVPLIIIWSGHIPADKRITTPVSITGIAATLLGLVDAKGQNGFSSPSLAKLWDDPAAASNWLYPISELAKIPWAPLQNPSAHGAMSSVVTDEWHYITHTQFGEELFRRTDDPLEIEDYSDELNSNQILNEFRKYLQETVRGTDQ